jgi:TM2 domain-containing membrane protein YozV
MKKVSRLFVVALLVSITVVLSSSIPFSKAPIPEKTPVTATTETPSPSTENTGKKASLSYKELKAIATQVKGSKLTLKEKIGLKLFGKRIANKLSKSMPGGGGKSQVVALILCGLVGGLGIHRFYLGYIWQGIVQLLTLGGCGIWALIDFIRIATGDLQPRDGDYDVTL